MRASLLFFVVFIGLSAFGPTPQHTDWKEMIDFQAIMKPLYTASKKGDMTPAREKAPDLYRAAKIWLNSPIPQDFKEAETKKQLEILLKQSNNLISLAYEKKPDAEIKASVEILHTACHTIMTDCKK